MVLLFVDLSNIFPENLTMYQMLKDITPVFAFIACGAYYVFISRNTIKTRKAQLFMNLYSQFRAWDFMKPWSEMFFEWQWEDFDDYIERYGPENNTDAFAKYCSIAAYFEGIGVLVKQRLIDIDVVDELMAVPAIWMWDKMEDITMGFRTRFDAPELWEWWEYLYHKLKDRRSNTKLR